MNKPGNAKEIIHRFFRVSDEVTSTFPGLGLGLYICSEIIKNQNGRIWVESAPKDGSTFCFSLSIWKGTPTVYSLHILK
jgi:signal transduction histidine kinase